MAGLLYNYLRACLEALRALAGLGLPSDLAQDYLGARALVTHGALYPVLGPALAALGYPMPWLHRSTHPPTAFLFLVPFAPLSLARTEQLWALATLAALALTGWAFGLRPRMLLALAPLVLWPPVVTAVHQFPPFWLLGVALAWRYRDRAAVAGGWLTFAALAKLLPLVSLLWFVRGRRWRGLAGAAVVGLAALALLLALDPAALAQYRAAQHGNTAETIARADNGALVPYLWHVASPLATVAAGALLALVAWRLLSRPADDLPSWHLLTWLGVALLPIAWTYSVLPLLAGLLWTLRRGTWPARALALVGFLAPWLGAQPSTSPGAVALTIVASGAALALSAAPLAATNSARSSPVVAPPASSAHQSDSLAPDRPSGY